MNTYVKLILIYHDTIIKNLLNNVFGETKTIKLNIFKFIAIIMIKYCVIHKK